MGATPGRIAKIAQNDFQKYSDKGLAIIYRHYSLFLVTLFCYGSGASEVTTITTRGDSAENQGGLGTGTVAGSIFK